MPCGLVPEKSVRSCSIVRYIWNLICYKGMRVLLKTWSLKFDYARRILMIFLLWSFTSNWWDLEQARFDKERYRSYRSLYRYIDRVTITSGKSLNFWSRYTLNLVSRRLVQDSFGLMGFAGVLTQFENGWLIKEYLLLAVMETSLRKWISFECHGSDDNVLNMLLEIIQNKYILISTIYYETK